MFLLFLSYPSCPRTPTSSSSAPKRSSCSGWSRTTRCCSTTSCSSYKWVSSSRSGALGLRWTEMFRAASLSVDSFCTGKCTSRLVHLEQFRELELNRIDMWLKVDKLSLNLDKTHCMPVKNSCDDFTMGSETI